MLFPSSVIMTIRPSSTIFVAKLAPTLIDEVTKHVSVRLLGVSLFLLRLSPGLIAVIPRDLLPIVRKSNHCTSLPPSHFCTIIVHHSKLRTSLWSSNFYLPIPSTLSPFKQHQHYLCTTISCSNRTSICGFSPSVVLLSINVTSLHNVFSICTRSVDGKAACVPLLSAVGRLLGTHR